MARLLPWALLLVLAGAVLLRGAVTPYAACGVQLLLALLGLVVAAQRRQPVLRNGARALPLAWAGVALASLAWSRDADATLDASAAVLATSLAFLLGTLLPGSQARRRFCAGFAVFGGFVACGALASVGPGEQAAFPFRNPNHLASWLLLPGALALVGTLSENVSRRGQREDALLWFGLTVITGAALASASSLGASLSVLAALSALVLLRRNPRRGAAAVGLCFAGVVVLLATLPASNPDWMPVAQGGNESSPGMRWAVYASAGRAALAAAPLGVGLGGFDSAFGPVRPEALPYTVRYAHSEPLQGWVELGIPFVILLAVTLLLLVRQLGLRLTSSSSSLPWGAAIALLALAAHSLVEFSLHVPAVALAGAILTGTLWPARSLVTASRRQAMATRLACGLLSLTLLALGGSRALATFYAERSEQALAQGRFGEAVEQAERGLRLRPWRASLHAQTAEAAEHAYRFAGRGEAMLARAIAARGRAVAASAGDAGLRLQAADTLLLAGEVSRALVELAQAARLDPHSPVPHLAMARVHIDTGDSPAAREALRSALDRHPRAAGLAVRALLREVGGSELARAALPGSALVHRAAAAELSRDGYLREAAEEYARALARAPSDVSSALAASSHFLRAGDAAAAEAVLIRALGQEPTDANLQQTLAALRSRRAQPPRVPRPQG